MWSRASFMPSPAGKKDPKGGRWTAAPADPDTVLVRTSHDAVSMEDRFAKNKVWQQRSASRAKKITSQTDGSEQPERNKVAQRVRQARELTSLIDALDKTDRAVEVILGTDKKKLAADEELDEDGYPIEAKVSALELDVTEQGTMRSRGTMHHFVLDFAEAAFPSYLVVRMRAPTPRDDEPAAALYVSFKRVPVPEDFDLHVSGAAELNISTDDKRFRHGKIWVTVMSLRVEAKYYLTCRRVPLRPPLVNEHEQFATQLISKNIKQYLLASDRSLYLCRSGPEGRLNHDMFSQPTNLGEVSEERYKEFNAELGESVMATFSMQSRTITVKENAFNPEKLRSAVAHIHLECTRHGSNKEKFISGTMDAREITKEFIRTTLGKSLAPPDPIAILSRQNIDSAKRRQGSGAGRC